VNFFVSLPDHLLARHWPHVVFCFAAYARAGSSIPDSWKARPARVRKFDCVAEVICLPFCLILRSEKHEEEREYENLERLIPLALSLHVSRKF